MNKVLNRLFGFEPASMKISTEVFAGLTTFLAMAYILAINPAILSATGMDKQALFTTTALACIVGTLIMAVYAKLPFALGPGMGLNAFFAYTVCIGMGHSWQFALTAILIEGIIFILLTVTNVREALVKAIPMNLRRAIGAGIGLFIAFIGLKNAGIIIENPATFVNLGSITTGQGLLAVIGIAITSVLVILKVPGSLLIGIVATTVIGIPMGVTKFAGVAALPPSIEPIFMKFELSPEKIFSWEMFMVIFTFLFVDLFDTLGTLVGVSTKANMVEKDGSIKNINRAFMADSLATVFGALLGTSTVTTFVESASGVAQGGRSGLTSFVTVICFGLALFFAPLFLSIPAAAVCPVLVIVGLFMLTPVKDIDLEDYSESIPAYLCLILMPLTFSISNGILIGFITYVAFNLLTRKFEKINAFMCALAVIFVLKFMYL